MQTPRQQARGGSASLCFSWLQTGAPDFPLQIWSPSGLLTSPLFPATSQALARSALCYPPVCPFPPRWVAQPSSPLDRRPSQSVLPPCTASSSVTASRLPPVPRRDGPFPASLPCCPQGGADSYRQRKEVQAQGPLLCSAEAQSWAAGVRRPSPKPKPGHLASVVLRKMQGRRQLLSDLQARSCRSWGSGEGLRYPQLARGRD